jgi:type II restriction/modification system DNA methylase subunit YeeA
MTSGEIEQKLTSLIEKFDREEFVYDFLLAYGISKTSVSRLKKGDFNLSAIPGEVLYKSKIFFKMAPADRLLIEAEESAKEDRILKQNPRFVIVTDFETLVAKDLKTKLNRDFSIAEIPKYFDFFLPLAGAEIYRATNDNKADRDAAYKLAQLYDTLITDNHNVYQDGSHDLNVFLSRLLFCFFAEDTGIFDKVSIFTETLSLHTAEDGSDVHGFLNNLFLRLNTKNGVFPAYLEQFPYVNGGLFNNAIQSPHFSAKSRKILLECGDLDWSEINPDIFGSMIQAVADPEERSLLGMHYTSVPNIKKLIEPLFLDGLYEVLGKNRDNAANLKKLINRIAKLKFFDPACGSGNFLIITYKELRLLEIKIIKRLLDLERAEGVLTLFFSSISLSQFYGIEIKDFAHEMAILSLWLAEHQMNKVFESDLEGFGQSKPILPLKESGRIFCDNATRVNWTEVCPRNAEDEIYILGNPPYLGARVQDAIQKGDMDFVFGHFDKYRDLDYISCWFYKAKNYIMGHNAQAAFVSTNSVCQGQQVPILWPKIINKEVEIGFAHLSFKWTNNAKGNAGVTVIIVGLRNRSANDKFLYFGNIKSKVDNINAYLIDSDDIYIYERNKPISDFPRMNFGNMPNDGGGLILSAEEKNTLLRNFPAAAAYIKVFKGSFEFINDVNRYCLWIENGDLDQAIKIPFIAERLKISAAHRLASKDAGTQKLASRSHQFRDRNLSANQLIVPGVSSERRPYIPIGYLGDDTIISNSALVVYQAQPWLFAVITSRIHMSWVKAVGGKLKTDYRYSAKLCYNTFPFPRINGKMMETLNQYVFQIIEERAKYSEKTMAWLYNPETMPSALKTAHRELDEAVERLYRLSPFESESDRLKFLFKLYEEMVNNQTLFSKKKKIKAKSK